MDRININYAKFVLWMAVYFLAYVAVALSIRSLSKFFNIFEIVIIRSAGSLLIAGVILIFSHASLRIRYSSFEIKRNALHLLGSVAFVWSLINAPVYLVSKIEFMAPIISMIIGLVIFKERARAASVVGALFIVIGIIITLLSSNLYDQSALLIFVFSAVFLLTITNMMLKTLVRMDKIYLIIFKMHLMQLPVYCAILALLFPGWAQETSVLFEKIDISGWILIAISSISLVLAGYITQASLASASRYSSPLQLCAADVLRLPVMAVVGYIVFSEAIGLHLLLPSVLVMIGSVIMSMPERKATSV
jgi:drug/metabolite transporter (DMT)-like permease